MIEVVNGIGSVVFQLDWNCGILNWIGFVFIDWIYDSILGMLFELDMWFIEYYVCSFN